MSDFRVYTATLRCSEQASPRRAYERAGFSTSSLAKSGCRVSEANYVAFLALLLGYCAGRERLPHAASRSYERFGKVPRYAHSKARVASMLHMLWDGAGKS
ncbi:hypothetical protein EJ02DRAFT_455056, partial [Clathrospora elynae]